MFISHDYWKNFINFTRIKVICKNCFVTRHLSLRLWCVLWWIYQNRNWEPFYHLSFFPSTRINNDNNRFSVNLDLLKYYVLRNSVHVPFFFAILHNQVKYEWFLVSFWMCYVSIYASTTKEIIVECSLWVLRKKFSTVIFFFFSSSYHTTTDKH